MKKKNDDDQRLIDDTKFSRYHSEISTASLNKIDAAKSQSLLSAQLLAALLAQIASKVKPLYPIANGTVTPQSAASKPVPVETSTNKAKTSANEAVINQAETQFNVVKTLTNDAMIENILQMKNSHLYQKKIVVMYRIKVF